MPTPGTDVGPFDNFVTGVASASRVSHLGGYDKEDRAGSVAYPGSNRVVFAREHNRIVGALKDIADSIEFSAASVHDVTASAYGAVRDGTGYQSSTASTDNYTAFDAAITAARTAYNASGKVQDIFVPAGTYDIYFDSDINDTTPGKHTQLSLNWPGIRIIGAGMDKTIICGKSVKTAVGRVASLVGNTLTFQTASDAAKVRSTDSIRIALNADGSGARTIGAGSISVEGPVTASANGNSGTGTVAIRNDGGRFQGVTVGDYVFADKAFALFRHNYTTTALTVPFNLTFKDLTLQCEAYGAVVDPTGDANPILDCPTYQFDSNPQPMGAGTSPFHRVIFDNVKCVGGYTQIHSGAGGNLTYAFNDLVLRGCDIGKDGMSGVYFGANDLFNGRTFLATETYFHDVHATQGSHLTYINSACAIDVSRCRFDGWRASNFACQHWGGSSTYTAHANWESNRFGTRSTTSGGGSALLTSEHGHFKAIGNTFESYGAILLRCGAEIIGNRIRPGVVGGTGIITYLDCQHNAQIDLIGNKFNLVNIVASGWQGAVVVESPVKMRILGGCATATDINQDSDNLIVPGNTGAFLVVQTGSSGGHIYLGGGFEMRYGTASGVGNVSWLATLTGVSGAAVDFDSITAIGRPANGEGMVKTNGRTSTDKIRFLGICDFTVGTNNSRWFYTTTLPAGVVSGCVRSHGAGATFINQQNVRLVAEAGPDIASAATVDWDQDYDHATITGTTTVSTMRLATISGTGGQLGYHGARATFYAQDGFSTDTNGNFAAAYTFTAGKMYSIIFNAALGAGAGKWVLLE